MRVFTLGFLVALCAPTAASVAATVSRVIPGTNTTTMGDPQVSVDEQTNTSGRATRTTNESNDRAAVTRSIVRTVPTDKTRATESTTRSVGRAVAVTRSQTPQDSARSNLESTVRNIGRSQRTDAASINANPAVRRMGLTLRPSTAEVGGRAVLSSGAQTGSNMASEINKLSPRIATIKQTRNEEKLDTAAIAEAKAQMEQKAELNKSCQDQYNDCMDQFCAVIDANQKRCSCSANLSKYVKVEEAVKEANTKLNEIAQNIRYVGLSADEISAIMSATEAEEAMTGTVDTTENRNLLSQIENMIKDPKTTSSVSYATDSYGLLDIDLDFSSDDFSDLFSLDFLGGSSNSFSNLRGTELYKAAKRRCETVIKQCKEIGATADQITGNYDLAIDKDCIAYEQGLTKMNETLVSNVRSATRMLQKARLAVLQNQNTYDAIGCVGALESCMKDDMVCGENYAKCLDPTKEFIDENGNVVLGQNINYIQKFMAGYNNATIDSSKLAEAYGTTISNSSCAGANNDGRCVVKYLLTKIGTQPKATAEGLCRPVLDKCRAYTYDDRGQYIRFNDIVVNYIQRAMVNIKAAQYQIVSDYASSCLSDIATCYNNQVSQVSSWSATATASSVYNIMRGACRNVALTCGYAVFAADDTPTGCPENDSNTCIENISEMFYQSLLCPDNSTYSAENTTNRIDTNNTVGGWVNQKCKCKEDYVVFNGSCLAVCPAGSTYSSTGVCTEQSCPNYAHITGSVNVNETADFWGYCTCNSNNYDGNNNEHDDYFWSEPTGRCENCANHHAQVNNGYGNGYNNGWSDTILNDKCRCDSWNGYVYTSDRLGCQLCPYPRKLADNPSSCWTYNSNASEGEPGYDGNFNGIYGSLPGYERLACYCGNDSAKLSHNLCACGIGKYYCRSSNSCVSNGTGGCVGGGECPPGETFDQGANKCVESS
ncbi:MAG: hypothetical protein J6Y07_01855 [Alphaproteobacteria bacterium]|nr:hypothetical protein [Alphaproteobacteria bacterium]